MTYKKKLIEVALPLSTINAESAREKSIRHGHPSTLHLWWARRPLAAARAVLWASLVDDPSAHPELYPSDEEQQVERRRLLALLERIVPWEATNDARIIAEARIEIARSCGDDVPKILDPFAGGGAIPLEALRLGLPTYAGDLNPVAVLIHRAMLEIPGRFGARPPVNPSARNSQALWEGARGLAADVEAYGREILEECRRRIGGFYPPVKSAGTAESVPIAWIWARTVKSPDPAWPGHVPLVRSWIVSKRPGRPTTWVEPVVDEASKTISYVIRRGGSPIEGNVGRNGATCIATGTPIPLSYVRSEAQAGRMGTAMLAVVVEGAAGRDYRDPVDVPPATLPIVDKYVPASRLPVGGLGFRVQNYGIEYWSQLFTQRQLLALTTFSEVLAETRTRIESDAIAAGLSPTGMPVRDGGTGAEAYADAVVTYLAFVIDKCSDYWSNVCSWHNSKEQIRNTFGRQAISMTWDFAETNPFSSSTGNWMAMVDWVVKAMIHLPASGIGFPAQRDARARILEVGPSMLCTDPPYYDNVGYADLSDFFYVWLRQNVASVWPDECATLLTPKADELIADPSRAGSRSAATRHFEEGMQSVFAEAAKNAHPNYPSTIFYAFKATESSDAGTVSTGWETFLRSLLDAGFAITGTWPMRTELGNRMRAVDSNALASSVVLVCRPRHLQAPMATRGEFVSALRTEMDGAVKLLQVENIAPVDLAQSAIGPGIAIFSRYAKVVEADGKSMTVRAALGLINEVLSEILSGEESEFDADTRFALTWFDQFGHNPGPFGDADLLARAKDTTVAGVERAGIVASRDGKVRLVERAELPASWDPATDTRLTVWETTQHLIRALDSSESAAAILLGRLGPGLGERARQLAYLLFGVCERRRWADDAGAYNVLVTAWPEISRLAVMGPPRADEDRLF